MLFVNLHPTLAALGLQGEAALRGCHSLCNVHAELFICCALKQDPPGTAGVIVSTQNSYSYMQPPAVPPEHHTQDYLWWPDELRQLLPRLVSGDSQAWW